MPTENLQDPSGANEGDLPPMPGASGGSLIEQGGDAATGSPQADNVPLGPPPSMGRQILQLVVIPAGIAVAAIIVTVLFSILSGTENNLQSALAGLRQSSGMGKGVMGLQDPKYKQRFQQAYFVAQAIATIEDPAEKRAVSDTLIDILNKDVGEDEHLIRGFLIEAIGTLGQAGGLDAIGDGLQSTDSSVLQHSAAALMRWPDREEAAELVPKLNLALQTGDTPARATAAWAIGALADKNDLVTRQALATAMESGVSTEREAVWGAAIALAKLSDPRGEEVVVDLLLNRQALAKLPVVEPGPDSGKPLPPKKQSWVLKLVLSHAVHMDDPAVWARVRELADSDPDGDVRRSAKLVLTLRPTNSGQNAIIEKEPQ